MGGHAGSELAVQEAFDYTSTRSTFYLKIKDALRMEVEFLTPIDPNDLQRLSIPASYLKVTIRSMDGQAHRVKLYADISYGEFPFTSPEFANRR